MPLEQQLVTHSGITVLSARLSSIATLGSNLLAGDDRSMDALFRALPIEISLAAGSLPLSRDAPTVLPSSPPTSSVRSTPEQQHAPILNLQAQNTSQPMTTNQLPSDNKPFNEAIPNLSSGSTSIPVPPPQPICFAQGQCTP